MRPTNHYSANVTLKNNCIEENCAMGMFWNMHQDRKIKDSSNQAASAMRQSMRSDDKVKQLEQRLNHLALYTQAMWELIRENTKLNDSDIETRALEIDLRDGKADGKMNSQLVVCPACARNNNSTKKTCMYCGAELPRNHLFES
jgi:hypothetical protein